MSAQPFAFIVDDEPAMLDIASFALETQGFRTATFSTAEAAWAALTRTRPDIVLLDVMLPAASGMDLCRRIKSTWHIPVILVTAKGEAHDRISGLEAAADDYVTKPYHPRELALRSQRLVRQPDSAQALHTVWGTLNLDTTNNAAALGGNHISLTINESKLLNAFLTHPGITLSYDQLLMLGWGESERLGHRQMIKAAIYRLRHKLDETVPGSSALVESVRGTGYKLRSPGSSTARDTAQQ
ncbi:response regulator transcription factor [Tsukamurella sp. 1534]|uniref:response regulator transcription factor n=1 Tax=Tsukamurella sp. 1534 TaxID=1151061 RepID=UPI0002E62064|nr:response regulator transcription factor [Tsukamurella sp. 1534]